MYTTLAYRFPGESSIELGMSDGAKSKNISTQVSWVAFKQQFFSSVFIARRTSPYANLAFDTAAPESSLPKTFTAQMGVPYTPQTEGYDFAFYFGPNKYSILKKVDVRRRDPSRTARAALGWGIFGWVNRWCVIRSSTSCATTSAASASSSYDSGGAGEAGDLAAFTYKSYVSMAKMRLIKPQVDELNKNTPSRRMR